MQEGLAEHPTPLPAPAVVGDPSHAEGVVQGDADEEAAADVVNREGLEGKEVLTASGSLLQTPPTSSLEASVSSPPSQGAGSSPGVAGALPAAVVPQEPGEAALPVDTLSTRPGLEHPDGTLEEQEETACSAQAAPPMGRGSSKHPCSGDEEWSGSGGRTLSERGGRGERRPSLSFSSLVRG